MIEKINYKDNLLALIIRKKKYEKKKGINFFTSQNLPLQVAYMQHVKNHKIHPKDVSYQISYTISKRFRRVCIIKTSQDSS